MIAIEKYKEIEKELSQTFGAFDLFALFLREGSPGKWDLLVSADWVEENKQKGIKTIADKLQNCLLSEELIKISKIVVIAEDNPSLEKLHKFINIEHGTAEIKDTDLFGLQIKHAYIITSQKRDKGEAVI